VINAIRKEAGDAGLLAGIRYEDHLWQEKEIKSVANVTRRDVAEFLEVAAEIGLRPEFQEYPLAEANQALIEMKESRIRGAKVLRLD
jgi:propanol-preferring alcohol dehydrogenase